MWASKRKMGKKHPDIPINDNEIVAPDLDKSMQKEGLPEGIN